MRYLGEFTTGKTVIARFNTHKADGTPITLAGTPAVLCYKNSTTESSSTGITLTVDYDARTGLHHVLIDTSANSSFFVDAGDYDIVLTAGTVDSISVVGTIVATFSITNRAGLRPTTADRTLDVSAGGEAGLDWANVGSPTTANNLSGTTTNLVNTVTTYTGNTLQTGDSYAIVNSGTHGNAAIKGYVDDIGVAGAGLTALGDTRLANLDATVSSRGTSTLTQTQVTGGAYALNNALFAFASALDFSTTQKTSLNNATPAVTVSDKTGFSLANGSIVAATFGSGAIDASAIATDALGALELAAGAASEIATAVRTELGVELGRIDAPIGDIPTNAELATALGTSDDAVLAQVAFVLSAVNDILDDTGTSGVVLSAAQMNKLADHIKRRTQANTEASTDGDALSLGSQYGAIQQMQNSNTTAHAGKLTTFKVDGTTELGQMDLASDPAAEPITGVG